MGGSSKQTIGYKYFGGLMVVIGNRIEKLLDINPDDRGWILDQQQKEILDNGNTTIAINKPDVFGGSNQEGGWVGTIDIQTGSQTESNGYLKKQIDKDVSAYPNLSYLVFRGINENKGFELVSMSGMMKDFMLWVKRIHVKNDGSVQWHDVVSEIGFHKSSGVSPIPSINLKITTSKKINRVTNGAVLPIVTSSIENEYSNTTKRFNPLVTGSSGGSVDDTVIGDGEYSVRSENNIIGFGGYTLELNILLTNLYENDFKHHFLGGVYSYEKIEEINYGEGKFIYTKYKVIIDTSVDFSVVNFSENPAFWDDSSSYAVHSYIDIEFIKFHEKYSEISYEFTDINPVHKIREILTDYDAMNKPESLINDDNFRKMADRIFNEGLGISWSITEKSCKEALDELLYHIESGLRINRQTGLYEVVLFRDDLIDLDNSLSFNESNIKTINFDIVNLDEAISSLNVSYYDRELIKDSSFLLYENGLERTRGFSISENVDFPYFMNRRNAELVGNWKLKQLSSPAWKGSLKTGVYEARKINKYDVIKLNWKSKNIIDLPVRVMNINLGDGINNTVTIDFIEVIPYSNIDYTSTNADDPLIENLPPQPNNNIGFEMPYFEAVQRFTQTQVDLELGNTAEIGYLMSSATKPQNNSINAHLWTDRGTGIYTNMSRIGVVDYCPAIYLDQQIGYLETTFKVKNIDAAEQNRVSKFNGATRGTWILLNDEIMVFESFSPELMEITVKRGALDTIPHKHGSGVIFFSDEFSGFDQNQYLQGETVKYQVLTTTPSAIENLNIGASKDVVFNSRAIRPYPPANVKLNDLYYPETIIISNDIFLTWVDRNRIQQTGGNIIGWFESDLTVESGVAYSVEVSSENSVLFSQSGINTNMATIPKESLIQNKPHKIKLWSIRDGFDSYQIFEHNVFIESISLILNATVSQDKVVGSTVPQANINIDVDESLSANMQYDGSSIKGKTLPNSTITIEVQE